MERKKNPRVLFFPLYSFNGASSRYRIYQYLPYLEKAEINYKIYPFYSEFFDFISPKITKTNFLMGKIFNKAYLYWGYIKRFFEILQSHRYDLVFIQKELLPEFLLELLCFFNKNIVFDFDDAIFLSKEKQTEIFGQEMLKGSEKLINLTLKKCRKVIVGNDNIGIYAKKFCPRVIKIPIAIDMHRYVTTPKEENTRTILGWIGRQRNIYYLEDMKEIFRKLSEKFGNLELFIIGANKINLDSIKTSYIPWSYETEITNLGRIDIGLMPLRNDEWSTGKGGCKLLQYMAMGTASIASPVGINREIIKDGINGFLAENPEEWIKKTSLLVEDRELRVKMGKEARETVIRRYSLEANLPLFIKTISQD